ncbi:MAG: multicopper oxidase family protein [Afipia birgiae]|jgi:FtsP/CotA-like multicopper oxidase with cupredoxin domain|nr:multicopper oxidase family protein [Afipia birgiae]MBX9819054.1 multicopper oxidase family protein [Afipia birgiae]
MTPIHSSMLDRRAILLAGASLATTASLLRAAPAPESPIKQFRLIAAPSRQSIFGASGPDTDVWSYGSNVPGPELRVRQGDRIQVLVENRLPEETTVHWHGLRVPNAMDGVAHITQKPIGPGETFTYEFDCLDAGTFWYHPHHHSSAQVARGLYGALIVDERNPIAVDRDITWVLSDWRLQKDASIKNDFNNLHDVGHNGRIGNTVTVNGRIPGNFDVRAGERIRLRLINAANARIFGLEFEGHTPQVIALDGHPVEPHAPANNRIVLGPAMRADILLDLRGQPGKRYRVVDTFYRRREYKLLDLAYDDAAQLRDLADAKPIRLPANPLSEPDLENAERHDITLGGGMMGGMISAIMDGQRANMRTLMHNGLLWSINDVAAKGHTLDPFLTLKRNQSCRLTLINDTAWHHPMHLHGHVFRVIARNGQPTRHSEWQDTAMMDPRERVEIAFVADNPGDWMFHCHILEHQSGGMFGLIRVI